MAQNERGISILRGFFCFVFLLVFMQINFPFAQLKLGICWPASLFIIRMGWEQWATLASLEMLDQVRELLYRTFNFQIHWDPNNAYKTQFSQSALIILWKQIRAWSRFCCRGENVHAGTYRNQSFLQFRWSHARKCEERMSVKLCSPHEQERIWCFIL